MIDQTDEEAGIGRALGLILALTVTTLTVGMTLLALIYRR